MNPVIQLEWPWKQPIIMKCLDCSYAKKGNLMKSHFLFLFCVMKLFLCQTNNCNHNIHDGRETISSWPTVHSVRSLYSFSPRCWTYSTLQMIKRQPETWKINHTSSLNIIHEALILRHCYYATMLHCNTHCHF